VSISGVVAGCCCWSFGLRGDFEGCGGDGIAREDVEGVMRDFDVRDFQKACSSSSLGRVR
jgi:hypothetical protein